MGSSRPHGTEPFLLQCFVSFPDRDVPARSFVALSWAVCGQWQGMGPAASIQIGQMAGPKGHEAWPRAGVDKIYILPCSPWVAAQCLVKVFFNCLIS